MALDIRTLLFLNLTANLIGTVAILILWRNYRQRYPGFAYWVADMALQVLAILLILLRGLIPEFLSVFVGNLAAQLGIVFLSVGLQKFFGQKGRYRFELVVLALFCVLFLCWGTLFPNLNHREMVLSASMALLMGRIGWFLLVQVSVLWKSMARFTGWLAVSFVVVNGLRILILLGQSNRSNDFFQSGLAGALPLLVYMILSFFLTLSLILMVTQRLLSDVQVQEEKFVKAFHAAPYAVILSRESDGRIIEVNDGFEEITGFSREEALNRTTPELGLWVSEEARAAFLQVLNQGPRARNLVQRFRNKQGQDLIGQLSLERIVVGSERCLISCLADITEQEMAHRRLRQLATHDVLTGLPNRQLFSDRFETALSNAARKGHHLAIASLDFDFFKRVNDRHGHEVGDEVLVEAGRRLTGSLRRVDTVSRFGGDEFVLLLWEVATDSDALALAEKVIRQFHSPILTSSGPVDITVSLGLALYPNDGTSLPELLRKSDNALYLAKARGRNQVHWATPASGPTDTSSVR